MRRPPGQPHRSDGFMEMIVYTIMVGAFVLAFLQLGACNANAFVPETPRQALGSTYVTIEALADSVREEHERGTITDEDRAKAKAQLQGALDAANTARRAIVLDQPDQAMSRLRQAQELLRFVESMLQEHDDGGG